MLAADTIENRLEFARLPEGWAAVVSIIVVAGLLYVAAFLYRREQRAGASARVRVLLAGLRCMVILLLAAIWFEPVLATYIHRTIESSSLLLVDGSASMSLRDLYPNADDARRIEKALARTAGPQETHPSRAEVVRAVLAGNDSELLRQLAARNAVQVYQFGDKLVDLGRVADGRRDRGTEGQRDGETESGRGGEGETRRVRERENGGVSSFSRDPQGSATAKRNGGALTELGEAAAPATDIGLAIRSAVESQAGRPIAAVVVFSDGQFNRGEPVEVVARYARAKRIPVHVVGVGDPTPPRNLAVAAVEAPPNVFVQDPFKVTAHLRAAGFEGATFTVELLERLEGSTETRLIEAKPATVAADGHVEPVTFSRTIAEAAEVHLQVRVGQQEGETFTDDNQSEVTVRALADKMRVLLLAGGPSWEYRYLSRLLQRDATVEVSCWLQSADEEAIRDGNTVIDHFPRRREELLQYDCVVLLDPDPGDFDPAWAEHAEALVDAHAGGLLYVAGRKNSPRFAHDANTQGLLDLLPVVIDAGEADLIINELGHFQSAAWPVVVPPAAAGHPVLAMSDQPGENAQIWARLPGVYWHYPVRREKPVATVLLRHSNPRMRNTYGGHVLLATQFLGSGRTGFLAYDGTWRWRRFGDRFFNRFWIQLLRHLVAGKLVSGQRQGLLQLERETCAIGEPVAIEARLLDATLTPLERERVEVSIHAEGQAAGSVTLTPRPDRPGWYRGQFVPTRLGTYTLQIDLPGSGGAQPATIRSQLRVGRPDLEFRQTQLDRASLLTLAAQSAGGKYLEVEEAGQLASLIPSKTASLILTGQPAPLWNRWWTLAGLVLLLGVEWAVRKRSGLL